MRRCAGASIVVYMLGLGAILPLQGFLGAQSMPEATRTVVAKVNGDALYLEDVDALIKSRPSLQAPTAAQIRQHRVEIVSSLIDELLLRQYFRENGPKIESAEVDKQWAALEASLKEQKKTVADYLKETFQTEAQARAGVLLALQLTAYLKNRTTDAELKKYYENYKDYFDKVMVRTSHIVIRLATNAPETEKAKARQKLQALRQDILAGKIEFSAAAKEHSDCPSAPSGGDIGYIFRKWQNVEEAYARTAFALKVGALSEVVETDFGLHLIKATDRKEGKPSKFEECLDEVRDSYTEELRHELLAEQRKKAKIEIAVP